MVIGCLTLIVGLGLVAAGVADARKMGRLRRVGLHADGTVIDNVMGRDQGGRSRWTPVVCFVDNLGHPVEFAPQLRTGRKWPLGRAVKVLYAAGDPQSARVNTWLHVRGTALFIGGIGLLFSVVGVFVLVKP